jgi:hypothetical protein
MTDLQRQQEILKQQIDLKLNLLVQFQSVQGRLLFTINKQETGGGGDDGGGGEVRRTRQQEQYNKEEECQSYHVQVSSTTAYNQTTEHQQSPALQDQIQFYQRSNEEQVNQQGASPASTSTSSTSTSTSTSNATCIPITAETNSQNSPNFHLTPENRHSIANLLDRALQLVHHRHMQLEGGKQLLSSSSSFPPSGELYCSLQTLHQLISTTTSSSSSQEEIIKTISQISNELLQSIYSDENDLCNALLLQQQQMRGQQGEETISQHGDVLGNNQYFHDQGQGQGQHQRNAQMIDLYGYGSLVGPQTGRSRFTSNSPALNISSFRPPAPTTQQQHLMALLSRGPYLCISNGPSTSHQAPVSRTTSIPFNHTTSSLSSMLPSSRTAPLQPSMMSSNHVHSSYGSSYPPPLESSSSSTSLLFPSPPFSAFSSDCSTAYTSSTANSDCTRAMMISNNSTAMTTSNSILEKKHQSSKSILQNNCNLITQNRQQAQLLTNKNTELTNKYLSYSGASSSFLVSQHQQNKLPYDIRSEEAPPATANDDDDDDDDDDEDEQEEEEEEQEELSGCNVRNNKAIGKKQAIRRRGAAIKNITCRSAAGSTTNGDSVAPSSAGYCFASQQRQYSFDNERLNTLTSFLSLPSIPSVLNKHHTTASINEYNMLPTRSMILPSSYPPLVYPHQQQSSSLGTTSLCDHMLLMNSRESSLLASSHGSTKGLISTMANDRHHLFQYDDAVSAASAESKASTSRRKPNDNVNAEEDKKRSRKKNSKMNQSRRLVTKGNNKYSSAAKLGNKVRSNKNRGSNPDDQGYCLLQQSSAAASRTYRGGVVPLGSEKDHLHVSPFFSFLRRECLEVFTASKEDVKDRLISKKVKLGQVGIRCRFCAHLPAKERASRSSAFPSSTSGLYQGALMMNYQHFSKCCNMPVETRMRYECLKKMKKRGGTDSRQYWIQSARELGMVDAEPEEAEEAEEAFTAASAAVVSPESSMPSVAVTVAVAGGGGELDIKGEEDERIEKNVNASLISGVNDDEEELSGASGLGAGANATADADEG